jgi:hypothetical protein
MSRLKMISGDKMKTESRLAKLTMLAMLSIVWSAKPYANTNFNYCYDHSLWKGVNPNVSREIPTAKNAAEGKLDKKAVRVETGRKFKTSFGVTAEYGFDARGLDNSNDGTEVDSLRIFGASENAIAMLDGTTDSSVQNFIEGLLAPLGLTVTDGRGMAALSGKRKETDFNLWFSGVVPAKTIPGRLDFEAYLPIKFVETEDISWDIVADTKNLVTGNLKAGLVDKMTDVTNKVGLKSDSYFQHGVGDLTLMLSWSDVYEQSEDGLSNVHLYARAGLMIPTSERRNQDNLLSIPLGNDRAWGLPLVGGMDLYFENKLRIGASTDILLLFNEDGERRLRTKTEQTELLIPRSTMATREPGTQLRISLIGERTKIADVMDIGIAYQGSFRSEDKFSIDDPAWDDADTGIVNSSERFQESSYHNLIGHVGLNWDDADGSRFAPKIDLFYKYPLKRGKRVATYKTIGANVCFNF